MAVNKKCVITGIFIVMTIISIKGGEAQGTPTCDKQYITVHSNEAITRTKDFITNSILKRLQDPKTLKTDKPCLMRFFQAYQAAIASIEKASQDVSKNLFSDAIVDVVAYGSFVRSAMKLDCTANNNTFNAPNSDFLAMQKWVESSVGGLLSRLVLCTKK